MASQQRSDDDDMPLLGGSESINRSKSSRQELIKATAAEFLAVVLFVFVGVTAVQNNKDATDVVGVALAHGFMIFVLISITGHVSGGHVNPAVSLGVFLAGEISFVRFCLYFVAQLFGGILGGALALGLNVNIADIGYGVHNPGHGVHPGLAFCIETITTFVLVATVLSVAVEPKGPKALIPLCIGMAVCTGILATGNITGGSMNPARSFGPAFTSLRALSVPNSTYAEDSGLYYDTFWKNQWIYFAGPLFGATLAALNFRAMISSQSLRKLHTQ